MTNTAAQSTATAATSIGVRSRLLVLPLSIIESSEDPRGGAYCEEIQPRAPGPVHFARSTPGPAAERRLLRHGRGPCPELPRHRPGPSGPGRPGGTGLRIMGPCHFGPPARSPRRRWFGFPAAPAAVAAAVAALRLFCRCRKTRIRPPSPPPGDAAHVARGADLRHTPSSASC